MNEPKQYTRKEECVNAITHGLGILLAVVGSVILIVYAAKLGSVTAIVSAIVYGLSMILLYTMSTLYHAMRESAKKTVFQVLDHSSVFLLIAGTYTPIMLVLLGGTPKALILLIGVWITAIVGIILNVKDMNRYKRVSLVLYLLMGWAVVFDIGKIVPLLGSAGTGLLIAGGLSYTIGVTFYKLKRVMYMHGVWHLFVLSGSVLHYLCILRFFMGA